MISKFCIITIDFNKDLILSNSIFNESKEKIIFSRAQKQLQSINIGYNIKKEGSIYTIFAVEPGSKIDRTLFINEENLESGKLYYYKLDDYYYVAKLTENGWTDTYLPLDEEEMEMLPEQPTLLIISDQKKDKLTFNNLETEKYIKISMLVLSGIILLSALYLILKFNISDKEIQTISAEANKKVNNYNAAYFQMLDDFKKTKEDSFEISTKVLEISKICGEGQVKKYTYNDKIEDLSVSYDIMNSKKADKAIEELTKSGFTVTSVLDKSSGNIMLSAKRTKK